MKRKMLFILLLVILGITSILYFFYFHKTVNIVDVDEYEPLATEQFIKTYLIDEDGTIRTNFRTKEVASEEHRLSESIGLWLEYLSMKEDYNLFKVAAETTQDAFHLQNHTIAWEIKDGQKAKTNALIDDLRIIEALFREAERTKDKQILKQAKQISKAVMEYNRLDGQFVDFYDTEFKERNEQLTISYLNSEAFRYMNTYKFMTDEEFEHIIRFMNDIPLENQFYPKTYDLNSDSFLYDDEVNLIDQLYTAFYLERAGVKTDEFAELVQVLFEADDQLYGRYDASTKEPIVDYEGASVYALAIMYAVERGEETFAQEIYEKMIRLRVNEEEHDYYGGYVELSTGDTHSFDNLLPLIAERILQREDLIK